MVEERDEMMDPPILKCRRRRRSWRKPFHVRGVPMSGVLLPLVLVGAGVATVEFSRRCSTSLFPVDGSPTAFLPAATRRLAGHSRFCAVVVVEYLQPVRVVGGSWCCMRKLSATARRGTMVVLDAAVQSIVCSLVLVFAG